MNPVRNETTIGRAIMRLNKTSDGDILYKGQKKSTRNYLKDKLWVVKNIQMIFQDPT